MKRYCPLSKAVALLLTLALMLPGPVHAAQVEPMQPNASSYLDAYSAYITSQRHGNIEINFSVYGTGTMDEIGVLSIKLYESSNGNTWTPVKTYSYENYYPMLGRNKTVHSDYVAYYGTEGAYYKAYVEIWAGKNGGGDTRYVWTLAVHAV